MVLVERSQIMTFEQSEKPGLKRKLAHEPARQAQAQTPLVLAIYLLSHLLQSPELLCPRNGNEAHAAGKVHAPRIRMLRAHP
jgi:hypothetical protein